MLNNSQMVFLQLYRDTMGDVGLALHQSNLELNHFRNWMYESEFNREFNITRTEIVNDQLAEFRILIVRQLNRLLSQGYTETTTIRTTTTNKNGKTTIKKSTKTVRKPIPIVMVKDLLLTESFEKSVLNLSEKGIIPKAIARNLLSTANEYTNKLQSAFEVDTQNEDLNEEKTIALIKQALIGSVEDIG